MKVLRDGGSNPPTSTIYRLKHIGICACLHLDHSNSGSAAGRERTVMVGSRRERQEIARFDSGQGAPFKV